MENLIKTDKNQAHILTRSPSGWQGQKWQQLLSDAYISNQELLRKLDLNRTDELSPEASVAIAMDNPDSHAAEADFRVCVPEPFLQRMKKGDANDPLLLQVLARPEEALNLDGYSADPLQEKSFIEQRGLVHKYHGRVLVMLSGHCAINCRYCFRRHFPYQDQKNNREQWQQSLDYIRDNSSISEVILSGGDPLACSDQQLQWFIAELENISHLKRLRIHSRLPIVIPQRITRQLLDILENNRLKTSMVVHCNHAQELDENVLQASQLLKSHGIALFNQAVLLRHINDTAEIQCKLSETLFDYGIIPYYLHLMDRVSGAAHFDVSQGQAERIYQIMRSRLPGYLLPKLVREIPGETSKTMIRA